MDERAARVGADTTPHTNRSPEQTSPQTSLICDTQADRANLTCGQPLFRT
jgi:hypothetical protein